MHFLKTSQWEKKNVIRVDRHFELRKTARRSWQQGLPHLFVCLFVCLLLFR